VKRYAGLLVGLAVALVCGRLGVWQLSRRTERRALNAVLEARLAQPPLMLEAGVPFVSVPADSLRFRRARAAGRLDFANQVIEIARSFEGAPGVHVLTPLRLADGVGVLVDRGWTYSADGMTVDLAALREPDSTVVDGMFGVAGGRFRVGPDTLRVGYPLLPVVLSRTSAAPAMPQALRTVPPPTLDEGPHLSYAIQWFSFATIALVGGALLAKRDVERARRRVPPS
jgi:surfeit locus 1 family protein